MQYIEQLQQEVLSQAVNISYVFLNTKIGIAISIDKSRSTASARLVDTQTNILDW